MYKTKKNMKIRHKNHVLFIIQSPFLRISRTLTNNMQAIVFLLMKCHKRMDEFLTIKLLSFLKQRQLMNDKSALFVLFGGPEKGRLVRLL